jgi:hypothetical protein
VVVPAAAAAAAAAAEPRAGVDCLDPELLAYAPYADSDEDAALTELRQRHRRALLLLTAGRKETLGLKSVDYTALQEGFSFLHCTRQKKMRLIREARERLGWERGHRQELRRFHRQHTGFWQVGSGDDSVIEALLWLMCLLVEGHPDCAENAEEIYESEWRLSFLTMSRRWKKFMAEGRIPFLEDRRQPRRRRRGGRAAEVAAAAAAAAAATAAADREEEREDVRHLRALSLCRARSILRRGECIDAPRESRRTLYQCYVRRVSGMVPLERQRHFTGRLRALRLRWMDENNGVDAMA